VGIREAALEERSPGLCEEAEASDTMPWRLLMSLASSLLIVIGGMIWTYSIWKDSNQKFHELYHVRETVQGLHARLGQREARLP
jgi:hypothetical protein